jgi:diacylglycerol kinase (ATP)
MSTSPTSGRRYAVILNPAAGNSRAGKIRARLRAALEASGASFELIPTEGPRHAARLAAELGGGFDAVVAAGGDGTSQEVATGLYRAASRVPLGVLPLGTGNDFGDLIRMPHRCEDAVAALLAAEAQPIDVGHVRWREQADGPWHEGLFLNAVGIGFDAMVATEAARFKHFRGKSAYFAGIVSALKRWPRPTVRVERLSPSLRILPGGATEPAASGELLHEGKLFLAAVGNGRTVGGGFRITPHARPDDGLLDLCFVDDVRHLRLPILIPQVMRGRHLGAPEVVSERLTGLRIVSPDYGLPLHFDGEVLTSSAVEVEVHVLPGAVQVLCPAGALTPSP